MSTSEALKIRPLLKQDADVLRPGCGSHDNLENMFAPSGRAVIPTKSLTQQSPEGLQLLLHDKCWTLTARQPLPFRTDVHALCVHDVKRGLHIALFQPWRQLGGHRRLPRDSSLQGVQVLQCARGPDASHAGRARISNKQIWTDAGGVDCKEDSV